jgi:hypothetical protein
LVILPNLYSIVLSPFDSNFLVGLLFACRNPSFGLATKAKGVARVRAKRKPGNHITYSREYRRV